MADSGALRVLERQVACLAKYMGVSVPSGTFETGETLADIKPAQVVFQNLSVPETSSPTDAELRFWNSAPLGTLESLGAIFPTECPAQAIDSTMRMGFESDLGTVLATWEKATESIRICYLIWLLERYGWCFTAPENGGDNVSLYVAGKIEAARQACITRQNGDGLPYLLIVGGISGIQSYIFDIASIGVGGGVARRLRGRSLYVQLLAEVAALRCLSLCTPPLPVCNVIMSSGGKFYVVLPNTEEIRRATEDLQREIDQWLLVNLGGEIGVNLSLVEFGESGFAAGPGGFGDVLSNANRARMVRKHQVFGEVIRRGDAWVEDEFLRPTTFEGEGACRSCRKQPVGADEVCDICRRDADMGRQLPNSHYLSFYDKPNEGSVPVLGWSVDLDESMPSGGPFLVQQLNSFEVSVLPDCNFICRYLPKHLPLNDSGELMTFEDIAESQHGKKLLAHLKADVDHVGRMFAFGFKRERGEDSLDSMARIAEMSFALDIFFSGYLAKLMEEDKFKCCYSVFAGGDDLYVIGPREVILNLARRLQIDFARYVCRAGITLSAGIVFTKPGMPIARVSQDAQKALDESKDQGRNRLHLLGHTLPWDHAEATLADYEALRGSLTHKDCPSSLLYRLKRYSEMAEAAEAGNVLGLRYQALMAYDRGRNVEKSDPRPWEKDASGWMGGMANVIPGAPSRRTGISEAGVIVQLALYERGED